MCIRDRLTSGSANTFVGYQAGWSSTPQVDSVNNSMALGANSYTTASNQMAYGDVSIAQHLFRAGTVELNGDLIANGNSTLGSDGADIVTVNGQSSFVGASTFTSGAYFQGISSFSSVSDMYVPGGSNGQVLTKAAGGVLQWTAPSGLGAGDNLGNHIATMTVTANYGVIATTITASGSVQLGDAYDDIHGVNMLPVAGTGLAVAGTAATGEFAAKFYSGAALSAWIRKK